LHLDQLAPSATIIGPTAHVPKEGRRHRPTTHSLPSVKPIFFDFPAHSPFCRGPGLVHPLSTSACITGLSVMVNLGACRSPTSKLNSTTPLRITITLRKCWHTLLFYGPVFGLLSHSCLSEIHNVGLFIDAVTSSIDTGKMGWHMSPNVLTGHGHTAVSGNGRKRAPMTDMRGVERLICRILDGRTSTVSQGTDHTSNQSLRFQPTHNRHHPADRGVPIKAHFLWCDANQRDLRLAAIPHINVE